MTVYDRNPGFLDFAQRPEFEILENTKFRKLDLSMSSGEACLRLAHSMGSHRRHDIVVKALCYKSQCPGFETP
jgi:hypothetical protein